MYMFGFSPISRKMVMVKWFMELMFLKLSQKETSTKRSLIEWHFKFVQVSLPIKVNKDKNFLDSLCQIKIGADFCK